MLQERKNPQSLGTHRTPIYVALNNTPMHQASREELPKLFAMVHSEIRR